MFHGSLALAIRVCFLNPPLDVAFPTQCEHSSVSPPLDQSGFRPLLAILLAVIPMAAERKFMEVIDANGVAYFSVNASLTEGSVRPTNASNFDADIVTFLSETLTVKPRIVGPFSADLTSEDDPLLALISLLLLLVIESIVATILLRTYRGSVSNVGFSVKHFIDLARDFRIRHLIKGQRSESSKQMKRIKGKLLATAIVTLLLVFGLEGTVLFLSSPELVEVTNDMASYTLVTAAMPDWNEIERTNTSATIRPCTTVTLVGAISDIDQGNNQLSLCVTTNRSSTTSDKLELNDDEVDVTLTSDVHDFGVEHYVRFGNETVKFISRAYFTLGDEKNRMLRRRETLSGKEQAVMLIHKQYIAYLFSRYKRTASSPHITLDKLEALRFKFEAKTGPPVRIIKVLGKGRFLQVMTTRHVTNVTGVIPRGAEAFRYAHAFLKGSIALAMAGPDESDLNLGNGDVHARKSWLWKESTRKLNWLTLMILLGVASTILMSLRLTFSPVGTAEIAGSFVTRAVGAETDRPPALLQSIEKRHFRVPLF